MLSTKELFAERGCHMMTMIHIKKSHRARFLDYLINVNYFFRAREV